MSAGGAASAAGPRTSSRLALLRYAAVGAVATLAHYALLWWLVEHVHWWPALAAGAGAALGAQLGFVGNRSFTFQHRGPWLPAWWRFQLTALLGGVTSMAVVAAGVGLGLHYLLAQAGATLGVLVLTYLINRRWAFG
jgi:putative flippase GtrA